MPTVIRATNGPCGAHAAETGQMPAWTLVWSRLVTSLPTALPHTCKEDVKSFITHIIQLSGGKPGKQPEGRGKVLTAVSVGPGVGPAHRALTQLDSRQRQRQEPFPSSLSQGAWGWTAVRPGTHRQGLSLYHSPEGPCEPESHLHAHMQTHTETQIYRDVDTHRHTHTYIWTNRHTRIYTHTDT